MAATDRGSPGRGLTLRDGCNDIQ